MADVIHVDNSYCGLGRLITTMLIWDILEFSGSLRTEKGFVSIDQERAFNQVKHPYHTLLVSGLDS